MADVDPAMCKRCARMVPWFSFWGNLGLAIYKLIVGVLGRSAALVADAMHSFADVVGSTGILVATRVSAHEPDHRFPYGRGKAEFMGAIFVYTVLLFFAAGIVFTSIRAMMSPALEAPHFVTLLGAVVSVIYNYVMYTYATCVGRRNHSPAILADAFENRADAISSVACILGILGAMFVHPVCDPIAALGVGLIILWNCQEQLRDAVSGLLDAGMEPAHRNAIIRLALEQPHVEGVAEVRSRRTGARYWIDVAILVTESVSVAEADETARRIRDRLGALPICHHAEVYVSRAEVSGQAQRTSSRGSEMAGMA